VLGLSLFAFQASAASTSYFLDKSNGSLDGTNVAKVTVEDGPFGDVLFTVEVLTAAFTPGSNFGMQKFYFNDDFGIAASNIKDLNVAWSTNSGKNAGGGFGKYNWSLEGNGSNRTNLLEFRIAGVSGLSASQFAVTNSLNPAATDFFAAQISDAVGVSDSKYAGSSVVPVPAAVWLFASALGWLGWQRRRS